MPYRITVEKYYGGGNKYWTNVYHTTAGDFAAATAVGTAIANAELPLYVSGIVISKFRIDDMTPNTDNFITKPVNLPGTRAAKAAGVELLPFFVVARVDFGPSGFGRPSRKYLRGVLWEDDGNLTSITAAMNTILQNYGAAIVNAGVTDESGNDLQTSAVWQAFAMRQERRGSKKKTPHNPVG